MSAPAVLDRHEGRHVVLFGRDYRWHQTPLVTQSPKRRRVTWRWSLLPERDDERDQRRAALLAALTATERA